MFSVNEAVRGFLCIQVLSICLCPSLCLKFFCGVEAYIFEQFLNLLPNLSALAFMLVIHYINPYAHFSVSDL